MQSIRHSVLLAGANRMLAVTFHEGCSQALTKNDEPCMAFRLVKAKRQEWYEEDQLPGQTSRFNECHDREKKFLPLDKDESPPSTLRAQKVSSPFQPF